MKINEDYSDIERQIKDLGQFLETCTDKNQYYSAATSFGILNKLSNDIFAFSISI